MEQKVDISLDSEALDNTIEKANRLVELLREAQQIFDSLSGAEKSKEPFYIRHPDFPVYITVVSVVVAAATALGILLWHLLK